MNQSRGDDRPLSDLIGVDVPAEELQRLARVDALLRVAAAYDRLDAIAVNGVDPRRLGGDATC